MWKSKHGIVHEKASPAGDRAPMASRAALLHGEKRHWEMGDGRWEVYAEGRKMFTNCETTCLRLMQDRPLTQALTTYTPFDHPPSTKPKAKSLPV